jgi:alcohol dehydrogenase class IV
VRRDEPQLLDFEYDALPVRVVFGLGCADRKLAGVVDDIGARRVVVIVTEREEPLARRLVAPFSGRAAGVFTNVRAHVPVEVAEAARAAVERSGADAVLSVGGGSTTGTAKAVA